MIDNDLNSSVRSIARDMEASKFLIRQEVHKDIRYFSYKMRKSQSLSLPMNYKRKYFADAELFNKLKLPLQLNMLLFSTDEKKIRSESDCELTEQQLTCSLLTRWKVSDESQTPSPHYGVWWSLAMVTLYLHSSFCTASHSTGGLHQVLEKVMLPLIESIAAGKPFIWQQDCAMPH